MIIFDQKRFEIVKFSGLVKPDMNVFKYTLCFNCLDTRDCHLNTGHCLFAPNIFLGLMHRRCVGFLYMCGDGNASCPEKCGIIKLI